MILIYLALAVVVVTSIAVLLSYNRFVTQRQLIDNSRSNLDTELHRRHDMIATGIRIGVVGRVDERVGADDVDHLGQHPLVGERRDEALTLPVVGGTLGERRARMAPVVDVLLHAFEPVGHPTAPTLDEGDAQFGVLLQHASADEAETRHLVFVRMRDDMKEHVVVVAVEPRLRHVHRGGFVEHQRYIELFDERPQRIESGVVEGAPADRIRPQHHCRQAELADGAFGLAHRGSDVELRHDRGGT